MTSRRKKKRKNSDLKRPWKVQLVQYNGNTVQEMEIPSIWSIDRIWDGPHHTAVFYILRLARAIQLEHLSLSSVYIGQIHNKHYCLVLVTPVPYYANILSPSLFRFIIYISTLVLMQDLFYMREKNTTLTCLVGVSALGFGRELYQ